ncbi:alpha/beta fold hydrolase [Thaumasiovibrio subtropicus]|uniref:alpha/beta fold hydrolase n=1 Tax=Thaumasiovibrio subtropicus TaxID=1891207 RepID=UPI000B3517B9|nr:alpha/beta hydrolase [Thaumasiovibrio subtropicus]
MTLYSVNSDLSPAPACFNGIDVRFEALTVSDDVTLRVAIATPKVIRGRVLLLNGFTEFIEKYTETLNDLLERGWEVVTFDWRGQGLSTRFHDDPHRGFGITFAAQLADLAHIYAAYFADYSGKKCLIAHSMGGHMALRYLSRYSGHFDIAYCLAPMVALPLPNWLISVVAQGYIGRGKGDGYAWGEGPMDDRDGQQVDRLYNKLCHDRARFSAWFTLATKIPAFRMFGPSWQWLQEATASMDLLWEEIAYIDTPVVLFTAGEDKIVNPNRYRQFAEKSAQVRLVELPNSGHEILFETDDIRGVFWQQFDKASF